MATDKPLVCSANGYDYLYAVRRGDSLLAIIRDQYGLYGSGAKPVLDKLLRNNPDITNPNLIYPGQLLLLRFPWDAPDTSLPVLNDLVYTKQTWRQASRGEQESMADMTHVYRALGLTLTGTSTPLSATNALLQSNIKPLEEIAEAYGDYRAGKITKGQYDYARRKRITAFRNNIGSGERLLFGNKRANQVLRMRPGGGIRATQPMLAQVGRLSKISKYAARGGIILTGVSLAASCHQISHTPDSVERNKIAVEAIAGTAAGFLTGIAVSVFLVSNPVGWGVAVAIGVGSAATGYFAGQAAGTIYDQNFRHVPVVETLFIDRICH